MAPTHNFVAGLAVRNLSSLDSPTSIGLVVFIAVAGAALLGLAVYLTVRHLKRRKYRQVAQMALSPNSTTDFDLSVKKRPIFHVTRISEDQELQRQAMIQKSLASRTSSRAESRNSLLLQESRNSLIPQETHNSLFPQYEEEEREVRSSRSNSAGSLRDEWKEFEANLQRNRSRSLVNHPGLKTSHGRSDSHDSQSSELSVQTPATAELRSHPIHPSPTSKPDYASFLPVDIQASHSQHPIYSESQPRSHRVSSATLPPPRHSIFPPTKGGQHQRRVTLQEQQLRGQAWI
ncbi:unnamed protein product [Clonostachys rosea]|uniref:Uncharacterized protein n=1 Tax=Bionectria ochroleuca TaxID=29856 RepID=A0ABY6UA78_BIOOC|nr:unnamed protein product [Clonostachys rosea]